MSINVDNDLKLMERVNRLAGEAETLISLIDQHEARLTEIEAEMDAIDKEFKKSSREKDK